MRSFMIGFGVRRTMTHLGLAAATCAGLCAMTLYAPRAQASYLLTLGFGYVSLIILGVTLLIGPINLLRRHASGVNIDLRRDTGIWAGITSVLHVVFALLERNRGSILAFFFRQDGRPLLNLAGASNWIGAIATALLVLLLATSNSLMLRRLRGRRWKKVQRLNYVLAALVVLHTFGYQMAGGREKYFVNATALAVAVVLVIQLVGAWLYGRRKAARLHVRQN